MINEHNAKEDETYTMAENHFADLTNDEFRAIYLGYVPKEVTGMTLIEEEWEGKEFGDINWVE